MVSFCRAANAAFAFSADPVAVCSWVLRMPVSLPVSTSFENAAETDNTPPAAAANLPTVLVSDLTDDSAPRREP